MEAPIDGHGGRQRVRGEGNAGVAVAGQGSDVGAGFDKAGLLRELRKQVAAVSATRRAERHYRRPAVK